MGVTKLILLGAVLGTGVVGLDRVLVMTTGDHRPTDAATIAAAMPASQASPSVTRVPLVATISPAPATLPVAGEFRVVPEPPAFRACPSPGEPIKLALARAMDARRQTYHVVRFECESAANRATLDRVRESVEVVRGL